MVARKLFYVIFRHVSTDEKQNFVYFAVPKTGSGITRRELHKYCKWRKLICLGFRGACRRYVECSKRVFIDFETIPICCTMTDSATSGYCIWDAVVDHYNVSANHKTSLKYLYQNVPPDAVRFASFRHPVDHFLSWQKEVCKGRTYLFEQTVWFCHENNISKVVQRHLDDPDNPNSLANFQSRYLGFDGSRHSLETRVIPFVKSLDFVLNADELRVSWCLLKKWMKWPKWILDITKINKSARKYSVSNRLRENLEEIQWADMILYTLAKEIFKKSIKICDTIRHGHINLN